MRGSPSCLRAPVFVTRTAAAAPVLEFHFGRDQVFRKRGDRVEARLVRSVEEILKRRQDVFAELGLSDGRETPVRAKALHETLHRGRGKDLRHIGASAL